MKKFTTLILLISIVHSLSAFEVYPGEKDTLRQSVFSSPIFHDRVRGASLNVPDFLECNLLNWLATQPPFSPLWSHKVEFEIIVNQNAPAVDTSFQIAIESGYGGIYLRKDTITVNISIVNPAIVAWYTSDLQKGPVPLTVNFTNTSTGKYTDLRWDFGDGETSSEENPEHTYTSAGMFGVQLIASSETEADTFFQDNYIHTFNMPTVMLEGGGGICPGDSVSIAFKFTGSPPWKFKYTNGSEVFQDSTTFPIFSFFVKEAGSYNLTELLDLNDTPVTTFGDPLEVWLHPVPPKPEIAYEKSVTVCEGETILLSGPVDATDYFWTNSEKTQTVEISNSQTIALKVANEFACESPLSDSLDIEFVPVPEKPAIQQDLDTLMVNTDADSIQWYKNGEPISNSNSARLEFTESANYKVAVFNLQRCESVSDEQYYVISDAFYLAEIEDFFEIFPNPFNEYLQVIFSGKTSELQSWELMKSNGEVVQSYTYNSDAPGNFRINTAGLPAGIYFLKIRSKNLLSIRKLIKL